MRFETPEGATPLEDASGLKLKHVTTYADLCAAEAESILAAHSRHLTRRKNPEHAWLTEDFVRRLHRDMFGPVWDWAGTYRVAQTNVGVPPAAVREEVAKLCQDVAYWGRPEAKMPALERAARLHHRCVWIHPFPNGNGRHARLLGDIFLFSQGHALPSWPAGLAGSGPARAAYLEALRAADAGDIAPLTAMTGRLTRPERREGL